MAVFATFGILFALAFIAVVVNFALVMRSGTQFDTKAMANGMFRHIIFGALALGLLVCTVISGIIWGVSEFAH